MKKKISAYSKAIIILISLTVILALSTYSTAFCDWYTDNIYGVLCDGLSHATGLLPFALGEILMYTGILLVLFSIVFLILLIFLHKKQGYKKFCSKFFKTFLMLIVCLVFVYMPSWFIPFRGSVLGKGKTDQRKEFSFEEIAILTQYAADGTNKAADEIKINGDGSVTFPTDKYAYDKTVEAMHSISDEFPRLKGYYPPVKTAICSDILDRMNIGGYNYPFTMEPTHSKYIDPEWQLILDAHEYSHHKGYYKENEANLLSQLALSESDDPFLRMAGFSDMYFYLISDYDEKKFEIIMEMSENGEIDISKYKSEPEKFQKFINDTFGAAPELNEKYYQISNASSQIRQEVYEADTHPIDDMPAVNEVIEDTADIGWETQGEILQENTYDGVTLLLLQHFDKKLYNN